MGKRGPKPLPSGVLKLRNSTLAKSRAAVELRLPACVPDCPVELDEQEQALWNHLVGLLKEAGILSRLDGFGLARYCRTWTRWLRAESAIEELGETVEFQNARGEVVSTFARPEVKIARDLAQQLRALEGDFGLNPSARTSIKPTGQSDSSDPKRSRFFRQAGA